MCRDLKNANCARKAFQKIQSAVAYSSPQTKVLEAITFAEVATDDRGGFDPSSVEESTKGGPDQVEEWLV